MLKSGLKYTMNDKFRPSLSQKLTKKLGKLLVLNSQINKNDSLLIILQLVVLSEHTMNS